MAERHFSEEERARLAAEGRALPDGSYPMPDCDGVRRAREAYGRAPDSHRRELTQLINKLNGEYRCGEPEFRPASS